MTSKTFTAIFLSQALIEADFRFCLEIRVVCNGLYFFKTQRVVAGLIFQRFRPQAFTQYILIILRRGQQGNINVVLIMP